MNLKFVKKLLRYTIDITYGTKTNNITFIDLTAVDSNIMMNWIHRATKVDSLIGLVVYKEYTIKFKTARKKHNVLDSGVPVEVNIEH